MTRVQAEIYYWNQLQYAIGRIPTPTERPTLPSTVDPYVTENPSGTIAPTGNPYATGNPSDTLTPTGNPYATENPSDTLTPTGNPHTTEALPGPSDSGSEEESTPVILIVAGLLSLSAVGTGLVVHKRRKERMAKKKGYFDPTEPFDGIGRI